jgi:TRAP-type C4-dicarboxylate transport system substrate-binding protein
LSECIIIVSPDYWETLSSEDQQIFRDAARVAIDTNRKVNAELHNKLPEIGISIAEYCVKNGIEVIDLTPEERRVFQKAVAPVWKKYRKKIGNEIFDFMLKKLKEHQQFVPDF